MRRSRISGTTTTIPFTAEQLAQKFAYWGDACWMCRGPVEAGDHVKPVCKGGPHILANMRPACRPCNSSKGGKWPFIPPSRKEKVT